MTVTTPNAGDQPPLTHDVWTSDGQWSPPGGVELYFESGIAEESGMDAIGLEGDLDPVALHFMTEFEELERSLERNAGTFSVQHQAVKGLLARSMRELLAVRAVEDVEDGEPTA